VGLTKTEPESSDKLEAALTETRRDDIEHGTNAAHVRGCVCRACMHCTTRSRLATGQAARWTASGALGRVHTSVAALEADIRHWIDTWNENPKPFAWTKTADEILNSLTKYLARISGAGH
jgi:hypothetical protein